MAGEVAPGQPSRARAALENEGYRLPRESRAADVAAAVHAPEHRAAVDLGAIEPAPERPHRAAALLLRVGDRDLLPMLLLIGLRAADRQQQPAGDVEVEVLDVQPNQLRAPQRAGEAEQQQRPVPQPGRRALVDRGEQALERL